MPPFAAAGLAWQYDGDAPVFACAAAPGLSFGPETYWRAASISKIVTARVVRAAGARADDCADDRLGWPLRHPAWPDRAITVGMLATHLAGLSDAGGYLVPAEQSLRAFVAGRGALLWGAEPPGERMSYSNFGYVLLAAIAERLTGARFDELARQELGAIPGGFNWAGVADRSHRLPIFRRDGERLIPQVDAVVAALGPSGPDGRAISLAAWRAGDNPGVFSPQGGLRTTLAGALALASQVQDGPWLWQGEPASDDPGQIFQAYGWGVMRLNRPDLYPRPLIGHFANAYGMCGGVWRDVAAGLSFAYLLNGLPLGDDDDALRPEEQTILAALAELRA